MSWIFTDDYPKRMLNRSEGMEVLAKPNKYGYDFQILKTGKAVVAFMAYLDKIIDGEREEDPVKIVWAVVSHGGDTTSKVEQQELIRDVLGAFKSYFGTSIDTRGHHRDGQVSVEFDARIVEI